VEVESSPALADGTREVTLHLDRRDATSLRLSLPHDRIARWSWAGQSAADRPPSVPDDDRALLLRLVASDPTSLRLTVRGTEPVRAQLTEVFDPALTPVIERIVQDLPAWIVPMSTVRRTRVLDL
jgi:hypothetical protein